MLKTIFSDKLIKAGGLLFLVSMVGNVFNYAFQITMGRLFTTVEYGLMNSLLAMFMVMAVPLGTLFMVISKQTAEYKARGEFGKIRGLFRKIYKFVLIAGSVGFLLFLMISPYIKEYINAPSVIPVIILGGAIFLLLSPPLINVAVLQGIQDFKWMNIGMGLGGPMKFFFCVALVIAGLSVNGVMAGLVLASITIWFITYLPLRKDMHYEKGILDIPDNITFLNILPVLLANLAFAVMTQADMVLVKHLFSGHEAGIYASASIIGKAVMYLPGAIVLAMFPMVAESNTLRQDSSHLIIKTTIVTFLLSGSGALLLFFFPEFIIGTFFGVKYLEAGEIVRYFGVSMLPMALLLIMMNYFIAKGKTFFQYILFIGAFLEIVFILSFHDSLITVLYTLIGIGSLLLFVGSIILYPELRVKQAVKQDLPAEEVVGISSGK